MNSKTVLTVYHTCENTGTYWVLGQNPGFVLWFILEDSVFSLLLFTAYNIWWMPESGDTVTLINLLIWEVKFFSGEKKIINNKFFSLYVYAGIT